jgi:tetratricopeptide (TPR) repeat protein
VWNFQIYFPWAAGQFGHSLTLTGSLSEGLQFLENALKRAVAISFMTGYSLFLTWLGEAHLLAGRMEEAARVAEQALSRCRDCGEQGNMAWALRLLGEIASYPDRPDVEKAENYYRQAMGLAEELNMRPLIAHCHLGLGKLYRRAGKLEQANAHLTSATAMYHEMDMPFWLEKAEAETREL